MVKRVILSIDILQEKPEVAILDSCFRSIDKCSIDDPFQLSEKLLVAIDALLKSNEYSLSDLKAICITRGPASYTGLRIALTCANFMAYSLNIPIVSGKNENFSDKFEKFLLPEYFHDPVITQKKPRL